MTLRSLIFRSVAHYWRTHLGVILGVALAALVLTGSLMVGDSVKATLKAQALARVGQIENALTTGERFVPWGGLGASGPPVVFRLMNHHPQAGALFIQGSVERADGKARANRVQLIGVDDEFWALSPSGKKVPLRTDASPQETEVALNERIAAQLGVVSGNEISIRIEKPGSISKDAPLSGEESEMVVIKARVQVVVGDLDFGRFALVSGQVPPPSVFVPLSFLQKKVGLTGKVNLILSPYFPQKHHSSATPVLEDLRQIDQAPADGALVFDLQSYDLEVRKLPETQGLELRSPRIFLDEASAAAARANEEHRNRPAYTGGPDPLAPPPTGIQALTYFVNELRAGDGTDPKSKSTPYSMVTAIDAAGSGFVQAELAENEIQITRWLADDLGIGPGDKVTLKYFVMGERRQLTEKSRTFTVLAPIIEMNEPQLNTSWMPDFPNVPDQDGLKKWKPGFPFEAERIRKKDEDYWKEFRGTPKAFVNLRTGQEMWGNRWGNLTSIRYRSGTKPEQVERMAAFIDPAALGFRVIPLREQALAATNAPVDFGELFASFSFFLIVAAAVLTGLLFTFSIEQRATEAGLLLAVGWPQKKVRRYFLREGIVLAMIGSLAGVGGAIVYTKLVLHALAGVWSGATGGTQFIMALSPLTMAIGVVSSVVVAWLAMWWASRRLFKRQAGQLLAGGGLDEEPVAERQAAPSSGDNRSEAEIDEVIPVAVPTARSATLDRPLAPPDAQHRATKKPAGRNGALIPAVMMISAIALAVLARGNPGAFFGAGSLLLLAGIFLSRSLLRRVATGTGVDSLSELAVRNTSRRAGRSLATIAVLASGVFMVVAVDSFRQGPIEDATRRDSGTGGFALVGESSAPIYEDLNSQAGREKLLPDYDQLPAGLHVVPMRVRDGDDASCLNLNRALQPRLLGVKPEELAGRFVFGGPKGADWSLLSKDGPEVPGIVDANTLQWAMQKSIGDVLEYTDERGQPLKVRIAGTIAGSMLQGQVLIAEKRFTEKFPNAAGYRFFLMDCPPAQLAAVRESLSRQLSDRGLELVPAAQRLADFNAVENTYLSIFQVLGGLGMLLGSAGLGIVVARNVLERRREFGLLEAVGFTPSRLSRLVLTEHQWLLAGALGIGAASALLSVWPQLMKSGAGFPWSQLALLFGGMALVSALCALLATVFSLRGSQLPALRNE